MSSVTSMPSRAKKKSIKRALRDVRIENLNNSLPSSLSLQSEISTTKLLHSLGFLVVANAAALSVPVADISGNTNLVSSELVGYGTNEVEIRTPNEAKVLEARVAPNCRRIGRVISRISKSSAV